jgi:hypothetical protein
VTKAEHDGSGIIERDVATESPLSCKRRILAKSEGVHQERREPF